MSNKRKSWIDAIFGGDRRSSGSSGGHPSQGAIQLDLGLLTAAPDPKWLACVDFGTGLSKICLVRRHEPGKTTSSDVLPLPIGPRSGTSRASLLAPSTLYVVDDRVHFADRALQRSAEHDDPERERFDSPKQILSEMTNGALDGLPPKRQEPSQKLTRGDLMALLLAYMIWHAHTAAGRAGIKSLPKLRFARPAWTAAQASSGEEQLLRLFACAFAIAGTLRDRLDSPDGLPISDAQSLLNQIRERADLQQQLLAHVELGHDHSDCISRGFVPEATAVAAGAIRPKLGKRRHLVVVDVGAGTSDFGTFVTVPGDGRGKIKELSNGRRVVLRGGNFVDQQVIAVLKERAGLVDGMPASVAPMAYLKREASRIKEQLFQGGTVTERFPNGQVVRASLAELLDREPVKDFANELWEKFSQTFAVAFGYLRGLTDLPDSIEIILTGGGGQLPMVRDLVTRAEREFNFPVTLIDAIPDWMTDTNWRQVFPQLAVAIGGAMPVMPEQR